MTQRQVPRWNDLKPMLGVRKPDLNATRRRLAQALTIADLARLARRLSLIHI